jgi:uroporphyrinogen-III synthase
MVEAHPRLREVSCLTLPPLLGHAVGLTGDRRAEELTWHLRDLGASTLHGPVLHTRPIAEDGAQLREATAAVIERPPDYLLATTGIGIRGWINAAASWGERAALVSALARTRILARGPKVVGAVAETGLPVWFTEPTGQSAAMLARLVEEPLAGAHVAVQLPGAEQPDLLATLAGAGAETTPIAVYDWTWPDDLRPALRLVRAVADSQLSALAFTSRPAVRNFLDLAEREGLLGPVRDALRSRVLPVCVGPVTADEITRRTGARPHMPAQPLLGTLVHAVADALREHGHRHVLLPDGREVVVQGRLVWSDRAAVTASDREAAVLHRLITTRRTVGRDELLHAVWHGEPVDGAVLDTTVARLRRRLTPTGLEVLTVSGRGYLLGGDVVGCASAT